MNLSWHNTGQGWLMSRLTYFYLSYCPLEKICFPDFSLLSFVYLTCNLVYEFVFTWYRSSMTFVGFDLLLHELLPFTKIMFSGFFFAIFPDIDLKFHTWICLDVIQVNLSSSTFFVLSLTSLSRLLWHWLEIWYMNLSWHNTDQVWLLLR